MKPYLFLIMMALSGFKVLAQTGTNLALNKPVTASGIALPATNPLSNLVDDNPATWTSTGTTANASSGNAGWVEIDLGSDQVIEFVKITSRADAPNAGRRLMIATWSGDAFSAGGINPASPNNVREYLLNANSSSFNRIAYEAVNGNANINASTLPGAAGANLGPAYTTKAFNVGVHKARYIRVFTLQDASLDLAGIEVYGTSVPVRSSMVNGSFESNTLPAGSDYTFLHEATVDGWSTTEPVAASTFGGVVVNPDSVTRGGLIEIWRNGYNNVASNQGQYFVELNAFSNAQLSQVVCVGPGQSFTWSVAHRGREGNDVMRVRINDVDVAEITDGITAGGVHTATSLSTPAIPITTVVENSGWAQYTSTWTNTSAQYRTVTFAFRAVSSAGGVSSGNFLDDVSINPGKPIITFSKGQGKGLESVATDSLPKLLIDGNVPAGASIAISLGGTATRGLDYMTNPATGNLVIPIPPGLYDGTLATAVSLAPYIQITNDAIPNEPGETVQMQLVNPGAYFVINDGSGCVTGFSLSIYTILQAHTISGTIYNDNNGQNGGVNGNTMPAGTTVVLYSSDGITILAATTTDANGQYSFPGLVSGNYQVQVTPPSGYSNVSATDGSPLTPTSVTIANTDVSSIDFGINKPPVPNADQLNNQTPGQTAIVPDILINDNDANGGTLSADSITLIAPSGATNIVTDAQGDVTSFTVSGQGTWSLNSSTGAVTFAPQPGFTADPTPITYSVTDAAGLNSTPASITVDYNVPLPAQLLRFEGQANSDCTLNLRWMTGLEENVQYFIIEGSRDGVNYETVARVAAKGSYSSYQYSMNDKGARLSFYRLVTVDRDQSRQYSKVIVLKMNCLQVLQIYPNPTQDKVTIQGLIQEESELSILSMEGRTLINKKVTGPAATLDLSELPAGAYQLMIFSEGKTQTTTLIKLAIH